MRKTLLSSLLLVMLLLAACGSKTTTTPTTAPTASSPVGAKPGECRLAANPNFQVQSAPYAPISASDHILGSDNALITIIEYSDFT